ncbi:MAG: porin family protein [Pseudomonadota bacterium]
MNKLSMCATACAFVLTPAAAAQSDLYLEGGASVYSLDDASVNALTMRGGVDFHTLFGAEFEASFGLGAEEVDDSSGVEVELENQFAGYFVGRYPVLPRLSAVGRIGYTTGEFQTSNAGVSGDAELDGFAFGLGGEFMITEDFGLRGDYTRIQVEDDAADGDVNVFAITGVFKFGRVR